MLLRLSILRCFIYLNIKTKELNNRMADFGQREMHKAVCSDCNQECEVPFKPNKDKPVYCRDCYQKHKKF
ncbi:hypothetical protein CL617_05770 [archaeon]|nr:hypothetical protein [archaeon]